MAVLLEINRLTNCEMIFHTFRLRANKCWTSLQIGRCKNLEPYYQPADMALDTHVTALVPKEKMSMYTMLFISECLSKLHGFFGHGLSISNPRAEKIRIMLPVSENGEPDYQFMEDYIRELMDRKYKQYKIYAQKMMAVLEEKSYVNQWGGWNALLNNCMWKAFAISEVFDIKPGKRLVAADTTEGKRPFIGALDNNNGVARFVNDRNSSIDKNVLGVNYNGNGMVIGFYHPYECIFSDDVKRFHLKHHEDNQFVLLFMKACILMQKQKFGYLYKFNAERMAHTSIMLPVTEAGDPDYSFMEMYGKLMFARKYRQYLSKVKMNVSLTDNISQGVTT